MSLGWRLPSPGLEPCLLHGHLLLVVEVAEETLELAEALVVQRLELDGVAAAGRAGDLGRGAARLVVELLSGKGGLQARLPYELEVH